MSFILSIILQVDIRNGPGTLQTNSLSSQSSILGIQTSGLSIPNSIHTSLNAPTTIQSTLTLPSSIPLGLNNINQSLQSSIANSIRSTKIDEIPHNLVVHRSITKSNGLDMEQMYRSQPPLQLRNGIQDSYRREADLSSPLNPNENFGNSRVLEYDDEDHTVSQRDNNIHHILEPRPPDLTETRVTEENKRIVKPAPLQARLLSVVDPDAKNAIKGFYVIPQNTLEKKYVLIKNEPAEHIQVSYSCLKEEDIEHTLHRIAVSFDVFVFHWISLKENHLLQLDQKSYQQPQHMNNNEPNHEHRMDNGEHVRALEIIA